MRFFFACTVPLVFACSDTKPALPDAGTDAEAMDAQDVPPPAELERFCKGKSFTTSRAPATVGKLGGSYKGAYDGPGAGKVWKAGQLEVIKLVVEHPFIAKKIRVNFARGAGMARLRLVQSFGRSYPGNYPSTGPKTLPDYIDPPDVIDPVEIDVADGQALPDQWIEVPIPDAILLPTQHYHLVYEHMGPTPNLAVEDVPSSDMSRSAFFIPPDRNQWGIATDMMGSPGNYRMELAGETVCAWSESELWFGRADAPFKDVPSGYIALADVDGDGHDDAITTEGARVYRGDGKGAFAPIGFDPFPDSPKANGFVFADLDNDGDEDAFASTYVQTDGDGDGYTVLGGDCNDTDANIHTGANEIASNGIDDDCNGTADDGTSVADADGDGKSIAQGDCNDTKKAVFPGAPELQDGLDNDCNGKTDEIFVSKILSNDGTGHFTRVSSPDVEIVTSSTSVAVGDGNNDGLLDVYAGSWLINYPNYPTEPSRYYEGQGGGVMKDALAKAGMVQMTNRPVYGVLWTDWNNDGLMDIYVSNYNLRDNILWQNMGGTFVDVAAQVHADHDNIPGGDATYPGGHSFGSSAGDIDGDGDIDIFVPNISHPRTQPWADPSMLLVNQGLPTFDFENTRRQAGIIYDEGDVNSAFGDFDNDGDLDLLVIPTYPAHYSKLYENDGAGNFIDVTYESHAWIHMSQSAVWGDIDEDGDLDLIVTGVPPAPRATVFINRIGNKNHWVEFELVGTKANRDAIGARIALTSGNVTRTREVGATSSHPHSKIVHIGLGASGAAIDKLTVHWPGGVTETIASPAPDKRYRIVEGSGTAVPK